MVLSSNMTGGGVELEELFCRDVEAFNEVFDVSSWGEGGTSPRCQRGLADLPPAPDSQRGTAPHSMTGELQPNPQCAKLELELKWCFELYL